MTKLSRVSLTPGNQNSASSAPQKGVIIKIGTSYGQPNDCETDLLIRTVQLGNNLIRQEELKNNGPIVIIGEGPLEYEPNASRIVCIQEEYAVLEGDSGKNGEARKRAFPGVILKVSEEMKKVNNGLKKSPPLWGLTSICGMRKLMEDSAVALPRFLGIPSYMLGDLVSGYQESVAHLFGVYDGHGGSQVADFCRDRLHQVLAEEICIAREDWHNGEYNLEEKWLDVFMNCFHKLDDEVGGSDLDIDSDSAASPPIAPDSVGSTAVVALVCPTHIIVANCGDSRAVLCRGKVPMPLSVDHKPNREDERTRIEAAGGKIIDWDGCRVSGFLAVSRSIGDRYLRPYVVADPEVMFVPRVKEDDCLILASDGLWDVITNGEACDFARRRILLWHKNNGATAISISSKERGESEDPAAQDAADYLSRLALHRGSRDNISVIVVDLKAQRKLKKKTSITAN